ncbi:MAG: peptide-methionine (S)-S-oxide reductase MsrA [Verrucomicrobiota bacterium]|nr:peptide-methionine (S)-S-oxide reductase MsrA [Verrucomicrobiota bacterium]
MRPIEPVTPKKLSKEESAKLETIDLGAGCFWCIEAVLERIKGVKSVESGYMGGIIKNPTYRQICTGATGHAEIVRVKFDPEKLAFAQLLEVFWELHDPTTLNRQGRDEGTQYRSAIFYHSEKQKKAAEISKAKKDKSGKFRNPIVTEITKVSTFYAAEDYHQDYFEANQSAPYCRVVIWPKLAKLGLLKEE